MIAGLALILLCQLAGEAIVRVAGLPAPGPVVGLALLFVLLLARDHVTPLARGPLAEQRVETSAKGLLAHLSLLFVPAGVGVVQQLDLIAAHGVVIIVILAASAIMTLLATVGTFLLLSRIAARRGAAR